MSDRRASEGAHQSIAIKKDRRQGFKVERIKT